MTVHYELKKQKHLCDLHSFFFLFFFWLNTFLCLPAHFVLGFEQLCERCNNKTWETELEQSPFFSLGWEVLVCRQAIQLLRSLELWKWVGKYATKWVQRLFYMQILVKIVWITHTRLLILFAHWAPHTCVVLTMHCHVSPDLQHLCLKIFCFDSHSGCKMLQATRGGKKREKTL